MTDIAGHEYRSPDRSPISVTHPGAAIGIAEKSGDRYSDWVTEMARKYERLSPPFMQVNPCRVTKVTENVAPICNARGLKGLQRHTTAQPAEFVTTSVTLGHPRTGGCHAR